jgi:hypothetical protein
MQIATTLSRKKAERIHRREEAVIEISGVMRNAASRRTTPRERCRPAFVRLAADADLFTCPKI